MNATIRFRIAPNIQPEPPEWTAEALCAQVDPELWYPENGGTVQPAKRICNGDPENGIAPCPVKAECLRYALDNDERFGIWGGLSENERRPIRRAYMRTRNFTHRCVCGASFRQLDQLNGHRNANHCGAA